MLVEDRREKILSWINEEESVKFDDIFSRLDVSHMTIRRDLKWLKDKGYIHLVRGGAIRKAGGPIALTNFEDRLKRNKHQKEVIARYTVKHFVEKGDIIILEGGTTVSLMSQQLLVPGLTVITDGPVILNHAAQFLEEINVICCGGILRKKEFTFVGPQAEDFFTHYMANKCFISAYGFMFEYGLVDNSHEEVRVKQSMINNSQQLIVLLDSSKIGASSLHPCVRHDEIDILITDTDAKPSDVERIISFGIDVRIADESE